MRQVERIGCVVRCMKTPESDPEDDLSCSGIILSRGLVLTTACLILDPNEDMDNLQSIRSNRGFSVLLRESANSLSEIAASLVSVWRCDQVRRAIDGLFKSDGLHTEESENSPRIHVDMLSYFLLLQMDLNGRQIVPEVYMNKSRLLPFGDLSYGEDILLCSTPFGRVHAEKFFNCVCRGIVAREIDADKSLFLCDVRSTPGCQGGLVYKLNDMSPAAILIHPVVWKDTEPSGLSIAASLPIVISSLQNHTTLSNMKNDIDEMLRTSRNILKPCSSGLPYKNVGNLVRIQVGHSWGSGVVLPSNYILTCAHVVRNYLKKTVIARSYATNRPMKAKCTVIYCSESIEHFDIAILMVSDVTIPAPPIAISKTLHCGQKLSAFGFGIFKDSDTPLATTGVVCKISSISFLNNLIVTSCYVHPGSSGGVLLDAEGSIAALIIANITDKTNQITYGNISLAIPMSLIEPCITNLLDYNSLLSFNELERFLSEFPTNNGIVSKL